MRCATRTKVAYIKPDLRGRESQNCFVQRYFTPQVIFLNNCNIKAVRMKKKPTFWLLHTFPPESKASAIFTQTKRLSIQSNMKSLREYLTMKIRVHVYYTFISSNAKMRHSSCFKCGATILLANSCNLHNKIEFEENDHELVSVVIVL